MTRIGGKLTGGMITETESYMGKEDRASHSYGGRCTDRSRTMYEEGGVAYVYLCYGIHHLFNIITHEKGEPHGILIRAIHPEIGIETMLERRGMDKVTKTLAKGPGSVSKCLGITTRDLGKDLTGNRIWVEDRGVVVSEDEIKVTPRIGVGYAKEWADKPLRFLYGGK